MRERRWRFLLNLIDHLRRDSYYVEAYADDDEWAESVGISKEPHRERLSNWSPEREALAEIADRLGVLISFGAAKGTKVPSVPRPRLAIHRLADRQARALHDRLHEQLYGKSYQPD